MPKPCSKEQDGIDDPIHRPCNGIMVIDKPEGLSSAKTISYLKKKSWVKKIGHTGTLDPFATGIMILGINQGTRLSQFFLKGDKSYQAELVLGTNTDTQDATGTVTDSFPDEAVRELTSDHIIQTVKTFEGKQLQSPPVYSALKHKGVPLYKLARQGKPVQKPPRPVHIYHIRIMEIEKPSVRLEISCSSGTYIRTLCADIGKALQCGGHLRTLRRTESCGFTLADAVLFSDINEPDNDAYLKTRLISMSSALKHMPEIAVDPHMEKKIRMGQPIKIGTIEGPHLETNDKYLKIINKKNELIAITTHEKGDAIYTYCCVFNH